MFSMYNTLRETNIVFTKLNKEKPQFCRDLHSKDLKMCKLDTHIHILYYVNAISLTVKEAVVILSCSEGPFPGFMLLL